MPFFFIYIYIYIYICRFNKRQIKKRNKKVFLFSKSTYNAIFFIYIYIYIFVGLIKDK